MNIDAVYVSMQRRKYEIQIIWRERPALTSAICATALLILNPRPSDFHLKIRHKID